MTAHEVINNNDVLDKMRESAGATEKAYAKMSDTAEMSQKKLENAFQNLKIAIGSELQDQMKGVYDKGTDLLEWSSEFVQENEWLVPVLEGVVLGIGTLAAAIAGFTVVTEVAIPVWVKFTAVMEANPVGLVAVAVVGLTAALAPLIARLADTTGEVEKQAAAWKEQGEALNSSVDAYREQHGEAALEEAQAALDSATEKYYGLVAEYQELQGMVITEYPDFQWMLSSLQMNDAWAEVVACTEAVGELQRAVSESDSALAEMAYDTNMYTIETAAMTEAERAAVDAILEAAEAKRGSLPAFYEEIEAVAQAAQEYNDYAVSVKANVENVMQQIQELQGQYQESYQAAYENIQNQIGLFEEMKVESSKSIDDMIKSLGSQIDYMDEYSENIRLAMEYGVDKGILSQLADGSTESAAILQEIVDSGAEKIQELNEEFARVSEGKEEFSHAVAELEAYYGENLDRLVEDTAKAVAEMAQYDEAFKSAEQICNGIIAGLDSKWGDVVSKYTNLARAAMRAYNKAMEINSPSEKFKWSARMTTEGIEKGVDEGQGQVLRRYEVLARESLEAYQRAMEGIEGQRACIGMAEMRSMALQEDYMRAPNGATGSKAAPVTTTTQTFNIYTPVKSPSELMRAARLEQQYGLAGE